MKSLRKLVWPWLVVLSAGCSDRIAETAISPSGTNGAPSRNDGLSLVATSGVESVSAQPSSHKETVTAVIGEPPADSQEMGDLPLQPLGTVDKEKAEEVSEMENFFAQPKVAIQPQPVSRSVGVESDLRLLGFITVPEHNQAVQRAILKIGKKSFLVREGERVLDIDLIEIAHRSVTLQRNRDRWTLAMFEQPIVHQPNLPSLPSPSLGDRATPQAEQPNPIPEPELPLPAPEPPPIELPIIPDLPVPLLPESQDSLLSTNRS